MAMPRSSRWLQPYTYYDYTEVGNTYSLCLGGAARGDWAAEHLEGALARITPRRGAGLAGGAAGSKRALP